MHNINAVFGSNLNCCFFVSQLNLDIYSDFLNNLKASL